MNFRSSHQRARKDWRPQSPGPSNPLADICSVVNINKMGVAGFEPATSPASAVQTALIRRMCSPGLNYTPVDNVTFKESI